ncbi:hypothetical protein SAMN05428981_11070 [Bacillus sp. OV194]|nr:hypothetical protein SAMN05428981_11070 [Bacillus sp. OV194]
MDKKIVPFNKNNSNQQKEENGFLKGVKDSLTFGSYFDKDMDPALIETTKEKGIKDFINHATGKKELIEEEQEEIKRLQKYNKNL